MDVVSFPPCRTLSLPPPFSLSFMLSPVLTPRRQAVSGARSRAVTVRTSGGNSSCVLPDTAVGETWRKSAFSEDLTFLARE